MMVYRLSRSVYATDLSGRGAELYGGRWNFKGRPMLYTGENRSLCMVEIAVHTPLGLTPDDYWLIEIELPENQTIEINPTDLPLNWQLGINMNYTQSLGDAFLRKAEKLILKVPSAVVQGEFNYLINPLHPKIDQVKIQKTEAFIFDERLFIR